jgi:3-isopropylmalate/(R)-2-methylmalate dehydratase small subunit
MEGGAVMKVWKYGDNVNTDMLFPGKYTYTCSTPEEVMPHLLEDLDPDFAKQARAGDVIMAGENFGCGSSREQPTVGLKALGIKAVLAGSFARIFYRSAINQGLILIECPEAVDAYKQGDEVDVDPGAGVVRVAGKDFTFPKLPPQIIAIRDAGGLLAYVRTELKERGKR